ncbi:hypothetical protein [Flavobacterium taihuense]|uniref:Uncharacterized protein n=1 Tax=Flavobacterium taihuense TaxID=2857508 RepID=A0ABS6XUE9_9FLAO|nr:hypothetical protein [Flavobacterium taihuense]MBW4359992.1 hypothetical protein [Flavobacterium taihuense]
MKLIYSVLFTFLFFSISFSQENYNWKNIRKIELYSFSKYNYCNGIKSSNLNSKKPIKCNPEHFKKHLNNIEIYHLDTLLEKGCVILRIYFKNKTSDFVVHLEQGVLMDLKNQTEFFVVKNKTEFKQLVLYYLNANVM